MSEEPSTIRMIVVGLLFCLFMVFVIAAEYTAANALIAILGVLLYFIFSHLVGLLVLSIIIIAQLCNMAAVKLDVQGRL